MHFVFGSNMKNIILHYFIYETWTPKLYIAVSSDVSKNVNIHQCLFFNRYKNLLTQLKTFIENIYRI